MTIWLRHRLVFRGLLVMICEKKTTKLPSVVKNLISRTDSKKGGTSCKTYLWATELVILYVPYPQSYQRLSLNLFVRIGPLLSSHLLIRRANFKGH